MENNSILVIEEKVVLVLYETSYNQKDVYPVSIETFVHDVFHAVDCKEIDNYVVLKILEMEVGIVADNHDRTSNVIVDHFEPMEIKIYDKVFVDLDNIIDNIEKNQENIKEEINKEEVVS